jgi:3-hydroxybutyryl-CoA dehydrogenase
VRVPIQTLGVIGAGQMGSGIAHVAALVGYDVVLTDTSSEVVERALKSISDNLGRQVKKEKITAAQAEAAVKRIKGAAELDAHEGADLVIEAATERLALKLELLGTLSRLTGPEVIIASNTSSISITTLAAGTDRPHKVVGMHFMNPVPVMQLVELIRGLQTSDDTFAATKALAEKMGKTTVEGRDMPGFIVNRILMPYINEAVTALYENIGSVEDIDVAMKLGTNVPMGPLTLADFIGLDTCLSILEILHGGLGDPRYRPSPLLRKYVEAGWLGKKSGKGFYSY